MPAVESPDLIRPAAGLLQGVAKQQSDQAEIKSTNENEYYKRVDENSSSAYRLAMSNQAQKTALMRTQMQQEGMNYRKIADIARKQDEDATRAAADKAKADYENFFTMTPELANGIYQSTKGRLDFRKSVGQRMQTKVVIPLAQMYRGELSKEGGGGSGAGSQKDLNALKAFTKQYENVKKKWEDPLQVQMAQRSPQVKALMDKDMKYVQDNEGRYNEAVNKIGNIGGVESPATPANGSGAGDGSTPPPTSASDEDALIDKAFQ